LPAIADASGLFQALEVDPSRQTDEEFWAEHDPFGDRYSKQVPLRGCLVAAIALALAAYFLLIR
jgi:hypothetical protein